MNQPAAELPKPVIGMTCGDINGIGIELIIKTIADNRILDICTPVIFASNKAINFYRKTIPDANFSYQSNKDLTRISPKQVNIYNCWEEEIAIAPGQLTNVAGSYAVKSLTSAVTALKEKKIHGLVTAPIHKKNIQSPEFNFTGHTPFLQQYFQMKDVLMLMVADNMRVGVLSEHVPVQDVAKYVTREVILSKLGLMKDSLVKDFGIDKPRIAVLALNPHAGDEGLIGSEEEKIIKPAIKEFRQNSNAIVFGPYPADAFFARGLHEKFDAVLAMYHDQGLIPFKSLAQGTGVNYTAGLPVVRTSPDHGTAFDIAGKNQADPTSFIKAIFQSIDIYRQRRFYEESHRNPLRKITAEIMANAEDENIEEEEG
jgi:4-hydroxythreonine-4-phosphate dehydrogenase